MYSNIIGVFLFIIILVAGLLPFYFNKKNMIKGLDSMMDDHIIRHVTKALF